jgi:hypothetical protein
MEEGDKKIRERRYEIEEDYGNMGKRMGRLENNFGSERDQQNYRML